MRQRTGLVNTVALIVSLYVILNAIAACAPGTPVNMSPVKVEIVTTDAGYQLMRGGEPYFINGAGMGINDIERFAAHGGNSIRTWNTLNAKALLDLAQEHGVTVALGLPMRPERHGLDYDDPDSVAAQFEMMREEVLKYRDHPALLAWIIGNELNETNTNPAVYDAVNNVAALIHELDPNHPTTTTTSGFKPDVNAVIQSRAPELDFISFQMYGSLFDLPKRLADSGFDGPFAVTEWGTIGYWEMETASWGVPIEMTSSEKADKIQSAYRDILAPLEGKLIGSYVFLWGQKQERTPTWFGMFTDDGLETEVVDVMHYVWTGTWPGNRSPRVQTMLLDGRTSRESVILSQGQAYEAVFDVLDSDRDPLTYRWEIKPESAAASGGGDYEEPIANLDGFLSDHGGATITVMPLVPGKYRLFAYAFDDHGHAAHANIPFLVEEQLKQSPDNLLAGEVMAVAYSGFREGQHPDRGFGAKNPSDEEILEDLENGAAGPDRHRSDKE
jgi:hypothetical protein